MYLYECCSSTNAHEILLNISNGSPALISPVKSRPRWRLRIDCNFLFLKHNRQSYLYKGEVTLIWNS